jgi:hypothetical protein
MDVCALCLRVLSADATKRVLVGEFAVCKLLEDYQHLGETVVKSTELHGVM